MTPNRAKLIAQAESGTLGLKRSTGELREAMQTLCAFANGKGGRVLIGVKSSGEIVGQQMSEQTLQELAIVRERMEPLAELASIGSTSGDRAVLVLSAAVAKGSVPFTYDGCACERVGNATRKMPQKLCEGLQRKCAARRTSPSPSPSTAPTLTDCAGGPARNPTGRG